LIIEGKNGLEKVKPDDIYFIEGDESGSILHLLDEEISSGKQIDEIGKLFPLNGFMKVSETFIVNVNKIFLVKFPEIIIADKMSVISVDENKKEQLEAMLRK
ncbi:MAG: LytTR family DNA-binding domain-containing protein, partial [Lentisphaerota bacterium]